MALTYQPRTEVYKFHPLVVFAGVFVAFLLQVYKPPSAFFLLFDLPLLMLIYFAFSRRNPSTGLVLGLVVGVTQDLLSHNPVGLYGMAKTLVGYAASSLSARIETDRPIPRLLLLFLFVHFHQIAYATVVLLLLGQAAEFISLRVLEAALVNALVGVLVFQLLDRFRKTT